MKKLIPLPLAAAPNLSQACDGGCQGCGKVHIKLLGYHDATTSQLLRKNIEEALAGFPLEHKIIEVSEPNAIAATGVATPALLFDGQLMAEGRVPPAAEIADMLRERFLHRSKLHRLRNIGVAVDISKGSDSALRFAWNLAQKVGANVEAVYVMDSIFEGNTTSASGFLSGYQYTMQQELDAFIRDTMLRIGVSYELPATGAPGQQQGQGTPALRSKVVYGFADVALEEYSRHTDLLVLGSTGQGNLGKKIFGSVSTEVSKRAHCPVLLVPADAEFRGLQNILYASDFDSSNQLQIQQAMSFARHFEGQVHFVHVGLGGAKDLAFERLLFETNYGKNPDQPFRYAKMVSDDVMSALYDYSLYNGIELLVFVTHQRKFWDNILHRSVTREAVISTDYLPTLIIHSDGDMQE